MMVSYQRKRSWLISMGKNSATRHFSSLEMWIGKVCQAESSGGMCPWKQIWVYWLQGPPRSGWRKFSTCRKLGKKPMRSVYTNLNGGNLWQTCQTRGMKNGGSCHTKPKIASFSNWHIPLIGLECSEKFRRIVPHFAKDCCNSMQF